MELNAEVDRQFVSIQAVLLGQGVVLMAIADDGTAWTAKTQTHGGDLNGEDLEWSPITALPKRVGAVNLFQRR